LPHRRVIEAASARKRRGASSNHQSFQQPEI
jgi:hypothetical protein